MFGVTSSTACCCAPPVTNCPNKWNNCPEFLTVSVPAVTITNTRRVKALAFNPSEYWYTRDAIGQCVHYRTCNLTVGQTAFSEYRSVSFQGLVFQRMASNGSTCGSFSGWGQCCHKYKLVTGAQQTGTITTTYARADAHIFRDESGGNPCQIVWKTTQGTFTGSLSGSIQGVQTLSTICGTLALLNVPDPAPTHCRPYLNIEVGITGLDQLTTSYPHTVTSPLVCDDDCYYDQAGTSETSDFGVYARYQQTWPLQPLQSPVICPGQLGTPETAVMRIWDNDVDLLNLIAFDQCSDPAHVPCQGGFFNALICGGTFCRCDQLVQTQNGFATINP